MTWVLLLGILHWVFVSYRRIVIVIITIIITITPTVWMEKGA